MSETELITKLASAHGKHRKLALPIDYDLWDVATIVQLLKRSDDQVRERVVCLPDFPKAIRLPADSGGRARPLWKAVELLDWADKYREVKAKFCGNETTQPKRYA